MGPNGLAVADMVGMSFVRMGIGAVLLMGLTLACAGPGEEPPPSVSSPVVAQPDPPAVAPDPAPAPAPAAQPTRSAQPAPAQKSRACREGQRTCKDRMTLTECQGGEWVNVANCAATGGDLGAVCTNAEPNPESNPLTGCHSADLSGQACNAADGMYTCEGPSCCINNILYACKAGKLRLKDHCDLRGEACSTDRCSR